MHIVFVGGGYTFCMADIISAMESSMQDPTETILIENIRLTAEKLEDLEIAIGEDAIPPLPETENDMLPDNIRCKTIFFHNRPP